MKGNGRWNFSPTDLSFLHISYKQSFTTCGFWCPASFLEYHGPKGHPQYLLEAQRIVGVPMSHYNSLHLQHPKSLYPLLLFSFLQHWPPWSHPVEANHVIYPLLIGSSLSNAKSWDFCPSILFFCYQYLENCPSKSTHLAILRNIRWLWCRFSLKTEFSAEHKKGKLRVS